MADYYAFTSLWALPGKGAAPICMYVIAVELPPLHFWHASCIPSPATYLSLVDPWVDLALIHQSAMKNCMDNLDVSFFQLALLIPIQYTI